MLRLSDSGQSNSKLPLFKSFSSSSFSSRLKSVFKSSFSCLSVDFIELRICFLSKLIQGSSRLHPTRSLIYG